MSDKLTGFPSHEVESALKSGKPICLFDYADRENETDVLWIGQPLSSENVDFLRRHVGGPLAVYIGGRVMEVLGIPTFVELVSQIPFLETVKAISKISRFHDPRFALSVDLRTNRTGCSPLETAATINRLYEIVKTIHFENDDSIVQAFKEEFVSPGHVPLIRASDSLLFERKGHSELSMSVAEIYNMAPFVVAGELISSKTLESMDFHEAYDFSKRNCMPFITGEEIERFWKSWK